MIIHIDSPRSLELGQALAGYGYIAIGLLRADIEAYPKTVTSGSLSGLREELIPCVNLLFIGDSSKEKEWRQKVSCPLVILDERQTINDQAKHIVRKAQVYSFFGKTVTAIIDRPIGSRHPKYPNMIYPINYGYIENEVAFDGENLDVYVLGIKEPLASFTGRVIAIIHRENDIEDKLVLATEGHLYNQAEIAKAVEFQEKFFSYSIDSLFRKSAGMIVYRKEAKGLLYLLLFQSKSQTWSFPKGHMEIGETEEDTAIREVFEETGQEIKAVPNFRAEFSYKMHNGGTKNLVIFLEEPSSLKVKIDEETIEYRWVSEEETLSLLVHKQYIKILSRAKEKV